jgi:hypothetical protein
MKNTTFAWVQSGLLLVWTALCLTLGYQYGFDKARNAVVNTDTCSVIKFESRASAVEHTSQGPANVCSLSKETIENLANIIGKKIPQNCTREIRCK